MTGGSPYPEDRVMRRQQAGLRGLLGGEAIGSARVGDLALWYAAAAVLIFVLPSVIRLGGPPWTLTTGDELQAWYWTVAFLAGAFGVTLYRAVRGNVPLLTLGALGMWPWLLAFLALMSRVGVAHSRIVALLSLLLAGALIVAPALLPRAIRLGALAVLIVGAAGAVALTAKARRTPSFAEPTPSSIINSALLPLAVTTDTGLVPEQTVRGGAIARLGAGFLLVTATGHWYGVSWDSTGQHLTARLLSIPAPMNREGVVVSAHTRKPLMRVTGLAVDTTADIVYVAHEVWRPQSGCLVLAVSSMRLNGLTPMDSGWRQVYATQPCVAPGPAFDQFESGGRLLLQDDGSLLLTVGDYGINRVAATAPAQQRDEDYGKILKIGTDGSRTLYSLGHRNPGGIARDRAGRLWVAEHGPRGGDEINLVIRGANYGWPLVTYGTDYGKFEWRFPTPTGMQAHFREPALVLVPSVGLSDLIEVQGKLFTRWNGDLLAGSLVANELIRVRLTGDRAAYAEPIPIGRRIRDVVEAADGRIVLWTDEGALVSLAPAANVLTGVIVYESCERCHGSEQEGTSIGPGLIRVIGRPVASSNFAGYSPAMKQLGGRWTEERLDAFLRDPAAFVPGTTMQVPGIADSAQRWALLAYLRR